MSRTRASAKAAGSSFERLVADYLASMIDERIDRKAKTGAKDRGDIGGLRVFGKRVTIECKNVTVTNLSGWVNEADIERGHDDGIAGIVVHKKRGTQDPGNQYVTCTLRDLVALLTGERPEEK